MAFKTIANGDNPDATVLMENFNFLAGGAGVKSGTLADLKAAALLAPTTPFVCVATDQGYAPMMYVGNAAVGDAGFQPLGGPAAGPAADLTVERG